MDIERFTHRGYRISLMVAVVLSAMAVTLAAIIGRGTLNLNGALIGKESRDTTVLALFEPKLEKNVTISEIVDLRKQTADGKAVTTETTPTPDPKSLLYSYMVKTSAGDRYLLQINFDAVEGKWALKTAELLHAGDNSTSVAAQN